MLGKTVGRNQTGMISDIMEWVTRAMVN